MSLRDKPDAFRAGQADRAKAGGRAFGAAPMIGLRCWPTPNGHKPTMFPEEARLRCRISIGTREAAIPGRPR